ncbi:MAG TPA: TonB family protein [Verrucomicrobiae bacterium]
MKWITPFKVATCLSLFIHAGIVSGYYAFHRETQPARVEADPVLEVEVISESEETPVPVIAPMVMARPVTAAVTVPPIPPVQQSTPATSKSEIVARPEAAPVVKPIELIDGPPREKTVATPAPVAAAVSTENASPANYLFNPRPAYPAEARQRKQEGLVVLAVQLDREGVPGAVRVAQSSGFALLDQAAANAVAHWRFTPARMGNVVVASQIQVPVRFKLAK